jgi:uncharacterized repeat protein (TIGR04076 family)
LFGETSLICHDVRETINARKGRPVKRREFLERAGCGAAGFAAAPIDLNSSVEHERQEPRRYQYEIEIFEAREDTWCHKKGDKFRYPDDYGQICTWLRGSMDKFLAAMEQGGELWWRYEGTPYEKEIDPDGVTTEFVRCPDPTADLVAKITKTRIA